MKKIAIKTWKEIVNRELPAETKVDFYGAELIIKRQLSLEEMITFVNECVDPCFDNDEHKYNAEIKDFVIRSNMIKYYTNLALPEDMSERYDMLCKLGANTNFTEVLYENIDCNQFEKMADAIEAKIDEENLMNELLFTNKITKVITSIETLINSIGAAMSTVSEEDIAQLIKKLKDDGFNEEKLVEAVLEHEAKEDVGTK